MKKGEENQLAETLRENFGHRLRVRVCGLYEKEKQILLGFHRGMGESGLWLPPGGGVEYGESLLEALKREWQEECQVEVIRAEFLFVYEVIYPPFHALEFFFKIEEVQGTPKLGHDPELTAAEQSLAELSLIPWEKIKDWEARRTHHLFSLVSNLEELWQLQGYYQYNNS